MMIKDEEVEKQAFSLFVNRQILVTIQACVFNCLNKQRNVGYKQRNVWSQQKYIKKKRRRRRLTRKKKKNRRGEEERKGRRREEESRKRVGKNLEWVCRPNIGEREGN